MKILKERVLPAVVGVLIIESAIIPFAIFGASHYEARIAAYIMATAAVFILSFEILNAFGVKLVFRIFVSMLAALMTFMPIDTAETLLKPGSFDRTQLLILIKNSVFNWQSLLIISVIALIFVLIELQSRTNMTAGDRFLRFVHIWFSFFYVINSIIFLLLATFRDWKIVLFILLAPSLADIGGFFGGKFFGKKWIKASFAPNISPKKTWEGFIVGVIACWIFAAGMIFGLGLMENKVIPQTFVFSITPFASVAGDLYFSYLKRLNATKDYSKILLGHGGLMDRHDSISFVGTLVAMVYFFISVK
ncbi:phosphatidate cytidylyltransferase [Mycoplasmopsis agalactiae]|uniref:phosphatidate cytidylyltransferase n=1 Tax=Mycoplasmopsis agalactiae TaxID=2110 RepID=UPI001FA66EF1|nr:phosphatidate cytidylyltransferase [Mycoplasmopsis agalactiae]MCE6062026.1 phosphatidate cytidylyltransferase [Mycoplasmopsis agalactiae]